VVLNLTMMDPTRAVDEFCCGWYLRYGRSPRAVGESISFCLRPSVFTTTQLGVVHECRKPSAYSTGYGSYSRLDTGINSDCSVKLKFCEGECLSICLPP